MSLQVSTLEKYWNFVFVETGTFRGGTVQNALTAGYATIISIEASRFLFERTTSRFKLHREVTIVKGDSSQVLSRVIDGIEAKITFFLDGHNLEFGPDTRKDKQGMKDWPLVDELRMIGEHPRKDHTILIDNVRMFGEFGTSLEEVKCLLLKINPEYDLSIISVVDGKCLPDEILVAEMKGVIEDEESH